MNADRLLSYDEAVAAGVIDTRPSSNGSKGLRLVSAGSVPMTRPRWIWDQRIPAAGTTLFVGQEGNGKTAFVCHLAARLTRGELAGDRFGLPGHVVYIGCEDDQGSVLIPRLIAAGCDLERFHFVAMENGVPFAVSRDVDRLAGTLEGLDVVAIIVDPLDAHLGPNIDAHRKAEVQATIGRLAVLGQRFRCAPIGIAHMNKGDSRDVLHKVVGSVGFTTSVRSVLAVGEHPDNRADRVVVLRKANMTDASTVPAVRFRVEGTALEHPDGGAPIDTAQIVIVGEEHGIDPNAILDVPDANERSAREEAAEWLIEVLGPGPLPSREVKQMAREADIAERTLKRARADLGVIVIADRTKRGNPTTWQLPTYEAAP